MKVLHYTTSYLAVLLLLVLTIWAGIFYYAMLDEIYDSIDDGLDNRKGLILQKLSSDSTILLKSGLEEGDYAIREIPEATAIAYTDHFTDTTMFMQNEQDFEPVRMLNTAFRHNSKYYQLQIATSMVEEDDLVTQLLYALIWLYAGMIITILLLNNFLLKRTWRPFYHLVKQLRKFRLENPALDLRNTRIEEFSLLNDAVRKMMQSNIDSYNSQKHFIENASHELQTPLAISINKLETLAESNTLTPRESELLESALDNLSRLTRLNRSLLLLSKIENKQFTTEDPVMLNELVKRVVSDFEDQASYSQITIALEEAGNCNVRINADLAGIMITNLVKNAILHNQPGGTVHIRIGTDFFEISNAGLNYALDTDKLFTRFDKQTTTGPSTGLGLSIVKAITSLYNFQISYSFDNTHRFTIRFR